VSVPSKKLTSVKYGGTLTTKRVRPTGLPAVFSLTECCLQYSQLTAELVSLYLIGSAETLLHRSKNHPFKVVSRNYQENLARELFSLPCLLFIVIDAFLVHQMATDRSWRVKRSARKSRKLEKYRLKGNDNLRFLFFVFNFEQIIYFIQIRILLIQKSITTFQLLHLMLNDV
jgi:hypothetical protein